MGSVKGLIVAAGQGTRLRNVAPLKPLATLLGKPLIAHVMHSGLAAGLDGFVVVTGYQAERLEAYLDAFAKAEGVPVTVVYNPRWAERNGLSVVAAEAAVDERFVLMMSDHLFDPEIVRGLMAAGLGPAEVVLAVDRRLDNPLVDLDDVTRVQTGPGGAIRRIGKALTPYDAFDTGLFLASRGLIGAIRDDVAAGGGGSISEGMQALADRGAALTFDVDGRFWLDVDDPSAFGQAEEALAAPARQPLAASSGRRLAGHGAGQ
jgi:1L-myo-inositol 1-phosphate cytidylyltransferase